MKKMTILIVLFVIFSLSTSVGAADNQKPISSSFKVGESIVTNEYLALKEELFALENKVSNNSIEAIIKQNDVVKIKQKIQDYHQHIVDIKKEFSQQQLKSIGYTDSQIYAIENYDGSENMTVAAATTITATPSVTSYTWSGGETQFSGKVNFYIEGLLNEFYTDHIGISIYPSLNVFAPITQKSSTISYKNLVTNAIIGTSATDMGDDGVNGAYKWKFATRITTAGSYYYITSAYVTFGSHSQGSANFVIMRFAYGHVTWTIGVTPGLTFGSGGPGVGITITAKQSTTLYPSNPDLRVITYLH